MSTATSQSIRSIIPKGRPPAPSLKRAHDIRKLTVCAYGRCRSFGLVGAMICEPSTDFQSRSNGTACYHGRCYAKKFTVRDLLSLPRSELNKLTLGDLGFPLMKKVAERLNAPGHKLDCNCSVCRVARRQVAYAKKRALR